MTEDISVDKIELDDTVIFKLRLAYGEMYTGRGKVIAVYKNGNVDVNEDGHLRKVPASDCTVLSKGG